MSQLGNEYNIQSFNSELIVKQFNSNDLVDGKLILNDAFVGDVTVINNQGRVVYAQQEEYTQGAVTGVKINLSSYNIGNNVWKVRYNKLSHIQADINVNNLDEILLYSLIFN